MNRCIVCEKDIEDNLVIAKYDVHFCCAECLRQYEEKLETLKKITNWDDCC